MRRAIASAALPFALSLQGAACGPPATAVVAPQRPVPVVAHPPAPPAWTYWEEVQVPILPADTAVTLPVDPVMLSVAPGLEARWNAAPELLREGVVERGFAVTRAPHPTASLGDYYGALRDDRVPWIVTLDALFFLTHVAIDRAHAEVDGAVVAPAVGTMLRRLETRLDFEGRAAPVDVADAYRIARGVVAVALSLVQSDYAPPPELAAQVMAERARVVAHSAVGLSPWLGIPVDYSSMAPRGRADRDESHASWFRAVAWLAGAGLALTGRGEGGVRTKVDVATARTHARAALLLSHVLDYDVDAEAATAWDRIDRVGELLVGPPDDVTPRDLVSAVTGLKLDPHDLRWLADVVPLDRARRAGAGTRVARVHDGSGGLTLPRSGPAPTGPIGALGPTFRLLGGRVTPDAQALQALVFPYVGASVLKDDARGTVRAGLRAMPTALDVPAWLGDEDARRALHASGDDAYEGYAAARDRLTAARAKEDSTDRHSTPYRSFLDALQIALGASVGDRVAPAAGAGEWRARKVAVALAAWTELRHDAMAMSRADVLDIRLPPRAEGETAVPIFVEPHPEAIGALLALVRQTSRGLLSEGAIAAGGSAATVLDEVADLLWIALAAAANEAADQVLPPTLAGSLAAFPARLRALEAALRPSGATDVPLAVDAHRDLGGNQVLEETIGRVEDGWFTMRDPATHRIWVALGASLPHFESARSMAQATTDGSWGAKLASDGEPPPEPIERVYFVPTP